MKQPFTSISPTPLYLSLPLTLLTLLLTLPLTHAGPAPSIPNFTLTWSDTFTGSAGHLASPSNWQYETPLTNNNNEIQQYTSFPLNANLSGYSTLHITPLYTPLTHTWTSARLSTHQSFGCANGEEMILQASIKLGQNDISHQQGFWPAFWTLGESFRSNFSWPNCGEWDIMELVNGASWNMGSAHWESASSETAQSLSSSNEALDRSKWHTYGVRVSRIGSWETQSIRWELDGETYYVVTGEMVGEYASWVKLVGETYFVILNIAVGGGWAGVPDDETWGGSGSGMEVGYVAVYNGA
ncbi:glycoside hydrolase family 16 protein [Sclerotinia borealis F-4128]|uniref:Glycoside hydrolase family 16 protein n=1 Tax=Sclerotinia borealis (strain F-4128) TaxID=1432307 RepID=W9CDN4_SCLBF|nr:glycoside hydrolase family 16 protein [Sclerotinia borealis F-4128]